MKRSLGALATTMITGLCGCVVLLAVSATVHASDEDVNEPFLESEVDAFSSRGVSYTTLSNEDLAIRADHMRDSGLNPSQRVMNYQWLSEHSDAEKVIQGDRAITKLVERHLKAYIDKNAGGEWVKDKLMPDSGGHGFIKSVDYDLKLHSDKLVIGISYEF